jgi:hypothetical protein
VARHLPSVDDFNRLNLMDGTMRDHKTMWVTTLANEVAPAEAALAPMLMDAFVAGGQAREDVLSRNGRVGGGFDAQDGFLILPLVLQSLAVAAPAVIRALQSSLVGDMLGAAKNVLAVIELRLKAGALKPRKQAKRKQPPVIDEVFAPLSEVIETMSKELRAAGLGEDQSDAITFRTLKVLLEHPSSSIHAMGTLRPGT